MTVSMPITAPLAPNPKGKPIIGNLLEFRQDIIGTMKQGFEAHGDIVRYQLGPQTIHVISHPDLAQAVLVERRSEFIKLDPKRGLGLVLGNGLVTSLENESWLSQRRMMQPMFHKQRLATMGDKMVAAGERLLATWDAGQKVGTTTDISTEMMRVTLDIITQTMFSMDVLGEAGTVGHAIGVGSHFASRQVQNPFAPPLWIPTPGNQTFHRAKAQFDTIITKIIQTRQQEGGTHGDLLEMLLEARDEDTGEGMNPQQLKDEVATIFAAGHETTANTLSWLWFVLSQHPNIRERLELELDTVLEGRTPTVNDLPNLRYTRQLFNEVLRFYPVVPFTVRRVVVTTTLGGYTLPAGSLVFISFANIHRHPDFWDNPDTFNPDGWMPDEMKRRHRLAFIPFGAGPRMCIGNNMALMEGELLTAMIAQRYRLHLDTPIAIQKDVAITMRPRGGLPMRIEAR